MNYFNSTLLLDYVKNKTITRIIQKNFNISDKDNEITLKNKTQKLEYRAFPEAIIKIYRNY